jgi:hypothetical protein
VAGISLSSAFILRLVFSHSEFVPTFTCTLALMSCISLFIGNAAVVAANENRVQVNLLALIKNKRMLLAILVL